MYFPTSCAALFSVLYPSPKMWWILRVKAGDDFRVSEKLTLAGLTVYVPHFVQHLIHNRTKAKIEKRVLACPGYLLIKSVGTATINLLSRLSLSRSLMRSDDQYVSVPSGVVDGFRDRLDVPVYDASVPVPFFARGALVRVDLFGVSSVLSVLRNKGAAAVLRGVFGGKTVSITVPRTLCTPV